MLIEKHTHTTLSKRYVNGLAYEVASAAIEVHKIIWRGLLENLYHQCMKIELAKQKIFPGGMAHSVKYNNRYTEESKVELHFKTMFT